MNIDDKEKLRIELQGQFDIAFQKICETIDLSVEERENCHSHPTEIVRGQVRVMIDVDSNVGIYKMFCEPSSIKL
jgi:hypothetical protein